MRLVVSQFDHDYFIEILTKRIVQLLYDKGFFENIENAEACTDYLTRINFVKEE